MLAADSFDNSSGRTPFAFANMHKALLRLKEWFWDVEDIVLGSVESALYIADAVMKNGRFGPQLQLLHDRNTAYVECL